jgi:hypothetical protein
MQGMSSPSDAIAESGFAGRRPANTRSWAEAEQVKRNIADQLSGQDRCAGHSGGEKHPGGEQECECRAKSRRQVKNLWKKIHETCEPIERSTARRRCAEALRPWQPLPCRRQLLY